MKKLTVIALAIILCVAFVACGRKNNNETTAPSTTAPTTTPTTTPTILPEPTMETNIPDPSVDTSMPDMTDGTENGNVGNEAGNPLS